MIEVILNIEVTLNLAKFSSVKSKLNVGDDEKTNLEPAQTVLFPCLHYDFSGHFSHCAAFFLCND